VVSNIIKISGIERLKNSSRPKLKLWTPKLESEVQSFHFGNQIKLVY